MALSQEFIQKLRIACGATLEAGEVLRSIESLVGDEECSAFRIWNGPGFGQSTVLLDVYLLGKARLYNYTSHSNGTVASSCSFLDDVSHVGIQKVDDSNSPYVLTMWSSHEKSRIFASENDLEDLEKFRSRLITSVSNAKTGRF